MAIRFTRDEVLDRLRAEVTKGKIIYEAAVGTGISAKWAEAGGADLIATYNIAKYRMMGWSRIGYFPIGDANEIVLSLGSREILPVINSTPVIAGIFGADPTRNMDTYLDSISSIGFSGILNCPTLALVDGQFRQGLEKTGIGYKREVNLIALAHEKGLFTQAFVTSEDEAVQMVNAGADMIIYHLGGTDPGKAEDRKSRISQSVERMNRAFEAALKVRDDVLLGCHGGPVAFPEDLSEVKKRLPVLDMFLGGSSTERLPVEIPIRKTVEEFKKIVAGR